MTAILEILDELQESDTVDTQKSISSQVTDLLEEDSHIFDGVLESLVKEIQVDDLYRQVVQGPFYTQSITPYLDDDFVTKIAIHVTFLQDWQNYDPQLDAKVAEAIFSAITQLHLGLIVNDISVNGIQIRDGITVVREITSDVLEEEKTH